MISQVPGINIEHIPDDIAKTVWPKLDINGGNCISVDSDSEFGVWLRKQGVRKGWARGWQWIVVWR